MQQNTYMDTYFNPPPLFNGQGIHPSLTETVVQFNVIMPADNWSSGQSLRQSDLTHVF